MPKLLIINGSAPALSKSLPHSSSVSLSVLATKLGSAPASCKIIAHSLCLLAATKRQKILGRGSKVCPYASACPKLD